MRKKAHINSDYKVSYLDEGSEICVDCSDGQVCISLPYAIDFKDVKITKTDNSKNNCIIQTKGLDEFFSGEKFLSLEDKGDWILLQSDFNNLWKVISFSSSFLNEVISEEVSTKEAVEVIASEPVQETVKVSLEDTLLVKFTRNKDKIQIVTLSTLAILLILYYLIQGQ